MDYNTGVSTKSKIRRSIGSKLITGWVISLMIPLVVLLIAYMHMKDDGYSTPLVISEFGREINSKVINNPSYDELIRTINSFHRYDEFINNDFIIVLRKGDVVTQVFSNREGEADIVKPYVGRLPGFAEGSMESNRQMFIDTGRSLLNQQDFYYDDGSEGSVFVLVKYSKSAKNVLIFVGSNLLIVLLVLLVIHTIMMYVFIRTFTNPLAQLLVALKKYKHEDFTMRLNEDIKDPMFKSINIAVNEMAHDLDKSQKTNRLLEEYRIEFLANMTHDTKTPLSSIRVHAEALRDGVVNDETKKLKYINNILKKTQYIDNMINELNLYSTLEKGIDKNTYNWIDMNYYLGDIAEEFKYDYNDQLIINYVPIKDSVMVNIDGDKFRRVFMNIIKNSVWYGNRDTITVDIKLVVVCDKLLITVKDNGIGVDSSTLDNLFESFVRGDESRNPNKAGTGLGLAIAKKIVESHGGFIHADSKPNEYFKIIIELPLKAEGGI